MGRWTKVVDHADKLWVLSKPFQPKDAYSVLLLSHGRTGTEKVGHQFSKPVLSYEAGVRSKFCACVSTFVLLGEIS